MRALLLSAGLGTRLKPLTNYLPKNLIPIHGRPLLDYWLELLTTHGVNEVLINTHYFSSFVVDYVQRSSWADNVTIVHEDRLLGTGGTILENRRFFKNEPLLVAHADNLTIFDPVLFFEQHGKRPSESDLTMMVFETPDPKSCGIVELDDRGVVTSFHEKVGSPPGNLANAALYILEPAVLGFMESLGKAEIDFSTEVIPHFMERIFTYLNTSYHRDIGTIRSWTDAHSDFPPLAASPANAEAWNKTLGMADSMLAPTMTRLLRQTLKRLPVRQRIDNWTSSKP